MTTGPTPGTPSGVGTPSAPPSRWQEIADRADVGLVRVDALGSIVDVNPAAARLLGRDMAMLRGIEFAGLAAIGERQAIDHALAALRDGEGVASVVARYARPRGDTVSTFSRFTRVCDFAGVLRAVTVTLLEIGDASPPPVPDPGDAASPELRQAMEALRASEERYRRLFESIEEGFCVIELIHEGGKAVDYRFLECNPAFEHHTGMRGAVGRRMREFAPDHEAHWFELYGEVDASRTPVRAVLPAKSLDDRWYEVHAFPFGPPGSHRIAVLFDDISGRMRAEQALRESESRFRLLANATPSMLWTATVHGEMTWLSERWSEYTGHPDHVTREQRNRAIHPDDRERTAEAWRHALRGHRFETELRLRRHDGVYRWFLVRANPAYDADGKLTGWYASTTDIHDHKLAESAMRDMDRRKDEFLATLAHELRNPLAPLRNCLHIVRMAEDAERPASIDLPQLHAVMERQVSQLVRLVDDLMEVSRITRGRVPLHLQSVTIEEVVDRAVETSRPLIDAARHVLAIEMPQETLVVRGDPVRLAQVLSNLLNNAAKYTDPGGRITLSARREHDHVVLVVRDDGLGMTTEEVERAFDLFSQAEHTLGRSAGGLGIGLTLVRSLVEMHGGTVVARSAGLGQGSEFEVRLPIGDGEDGEAHAQDAAPRGSPVQLRFLVVDDNREQADSLAMLLRMTGHAVRTAYDAATALTWHGAFDPEVVLLDLGLPGVDGHAVCRRLRASEGGARLVIVAITGWGQAEDRERSTEAGFDAHMVKPVEPAALLSLVETLLRLKRSAQ